MLHRKNRTERKIEKTNRKEKKYILKDTDDAVKIL
jgi:hypothetical protein